MTRFRNEWFCLISIRFKAKAFGRTFQKLKLSFASLSFTVLNSTENPEVVRRSAGLLQSHKHFLKCHSLFKYVFLFLRLMKRLKFKRLPQKFWTMDLPVTPSRHTRQELLPRKVLKHSLIGFQAQPSNQSHSLFRALVSSELLIMTYRLSHNS